VYMRMLGGCIWSVLIPLKLIAVVFAPAAILVDYILRPASQIFRFTHCIIIGTVWLMAEVLLAGFNYHTIGMFVPPFSAGTFTTYIDEGSRFLFFFFRGFLANWYGSIRGIGRWLPFGFTLLIGIRCLVTLRPYFDGRRFAYLGGAVLGLSWLLEIKKDFYADPRLMGYGLLILLLAFRPSKGSGKYWLAYGCATAILAFGNVLTTNSLGANDPRYAILARKVASSGLLKRQVFSNSFHILDIQARVASTPVYNLQQVPAGAFFLKFDAANFDAISQTVWRIETPPVGWPILARWQQLVLYKKPL
jgi:hypothetical protein